MIRKARMRRRLSPTSIVKPPPSRNAAFIPI
jgi:hypothetical protein